MTTARMDVEVGFNEEVTRGLKTIQSGIIRFVGAITAGIAAVSVTTFPIRGAIEFERSLANIAKTTGFTASQINRVGDALLEMSTQSSRSAVDLAEIATVAGQLGLGARAGVAGIIEFTRVIQMASTALNVVEEDAAKMGAQILNIFKFEPGQTENILSVINELSNTSVARGEEIADIVARIGTIAGLAFPQVASLAAYSKDLGVSTEVAGTSFVKIFTRMLSSAENFSELMQVSTDEWVKMVEDDAVGALKAAAAAVNELGAAAQAQTINKLFGQGRVYALTAKIVEDAANGFVLLDQHLGTANTQFLEGTSIAREFAAVMGTTEEQIQQTKNSLMALSTGAGSQSLPEIRDILQSIRDWASKPATQAMAEDFGNELLKVLQGVRAIAKAVSDLNIDWGKLYTLIRLVVLYVGVKLAASVASSIYGWITGLGTISQMWTAIRGGIATVNQTLTGQGTLVERINTRLANTLALMRRISTVPPATAFMTSGTASFTGAGSASAADPEFRKQTSINNVLLERQNILRQDLATNQAIRNTLKTRLVQQKAILASMVGNSTASAAQISTQRNIVAAIQAEIVARNRAIASTSGHIGALSKKLAIQSQILAATIATGRATSVAGAAALTPTITLWGRLHTTINRAAAAVGLFVKQMILPMALFAVAFKALELGVPKILKALGLIDNEQKRMAREERALEQQRQRDLNERAEVALEVYNRIVSKARDTQKQLEQLKMPILTETGTLDSGQVAAEFADGETAVRAFAEAVDFMRQKNEEAYASIADLEDQLSKLSDGIEARLTTIAGIMPAIETNLLSRLKGFLPFVQSEQEVAQDLNRQRQELLNAIQVRQKLEEDFNQYIGELQQATEARAIDFFEVLGAGDAMAAAQFLATRESLKLVSEELRNLDAKFQSTVGGLTVAGPADVDIDILEGLDEKTRANVDRIIEEYARLQTEQQRLMREQSSQGGSLGNQAVMIQFVGALENLARLRQELEQTNAELAEFGVTAATSAQEVEQAIARQSDEIVPIESVFALQQAAKETEAAVSQVQQSVINMANTEPQLLKIAGYFLNIRDGAGLSAALDRLAQMAMQTQQTWEALSKEEQARVKFAQQVVAAREAEGDRVRSRAAAERQIARLMQERAQLADRISEKEMISAQALLDASADASKFDEAAYRFAATVTDEMADIINRAFQDGVMQGIPTGLPLEEVEELAGMVTKLRDGVYLLGETVTDSGVRLQALAIDGKIAITQLNKALEVAPAVVAVEVDEQAVTELKRRFSEVTEDLAGSVRQAFNEGVSLIDVPELQGIARKLDVGELGDDIYLLGEAITESGKKIAAYAIQGEISFAQVSDAAKVTAADLRGMEPPEINNTPLKDQADAIDEVTESLRLMIEARDQASRDARESLMFNAEAMGIDSGEAEALMARLGDLNREITKEDERQFFLASGKVRSMGEMREEAMAHYTALKMQEETLRYAGAEVLAMAANARSFADNIGSWANSYRQNIIRTMESIESRIRDRELEIEINFKKDAMDKEIENQAEQIRKRWQPIIAEALRGGSRFRVRELQKQRDAEIEAAGAALVHAKAQEEVALRTERLRETQQRIRDNVQELARLEKETSDPAKMRQFNRLKEETLELDRQQRSEVGKLVEVQTVLREEIRRGVTLDRDVMIFTPEQRARELAEATAVSEEIAQAIIRTAPGVAAGAESFAQPIINSLQLATSALEGWEKELVRLGVPPSVFNSWRDFAGYIGGEFSSGTIEALNLVRSTMESQFQSIDIFSTFDRSPADLIGGFDTAMRDALLDRDKSGLSDALSEHMRGAVTDVDLARAAQAMADEWNRVAESQGLDIRFDVTGEITKLDPDVSEEDTPEVPVSAKMSAEDLQAAVADAGSPESTIKPKFEGSQMQQAATEAAKNVEVTIRAKIEADSNVRGGYIQGRARGGPVEIPAYATGGRVSGAGTGTSDSILSWLSNGEYVMDAWTTRVFGSKFFGVLQSIARGGLGASVRKKLKGVVPGFASGGPVTTSIQNNSMLTQLAGAAGGSNVVLPSETVNLNLNIGRETFSLQGPRDQVKGLVESIKSVNRGTMK